MRTNREGNLKRFFDIQETDLVLEVRGEALALREAEYDFIFWNPTGADSKDVCVQNLYQLLAPTGKLVVYFDNSFGIQAFAKGMDGQEIADVGYPLLTVLKDALKHGANFYEKRYYPYPCVEFPSAFFSDDRLPGKNECEDSFCNFDKARMEAFDERSMTDRIVDSGMYPYLAHAYMLIFSKVPLEEYPVYTRFSNERREDAQIRTDIYKDSVTKRAVHPSAEEHVLCMQKTEPLLAECLQEFTVLGKACDINHISSADAEKKSVKFAFVSGESLEQTLDKMLEDGKEKEVADVLLDFCDSLRGSSRLSEFAMTEPFREIFGEIADWQQYNWKALPVSDIDLVCQNILLSDKAVVIDYEWTFDFPVPVEFLVFRFLYFYLEAKNRTCLERGAFAQIYEKAGITDVMREVFLAMETGFQRYVQHGAKVLCNSFDEEGKPVLTATEIGRWLRQLDEKTLTLYKETGEKRVIGAKRSAEGVYLYKIPQAQEGVKVQLTGFDASEGKACVLRLGAMADWGGAHVGLSFETNGMHLGGLLYLYEDVLPVLTLHGLTGEDNGAEISVEEIAMSEAALRELKTTIGDMRFIIDNREQQIRDLKNSASWKVTKPLRALKGNKEE